MPGHSGARVGAFHGPQHQYGLPVSVVKPVDNVLNPVGTVAAAGTPGADVALNQTYSDLQAILDALAKAQAVK